MANPNKIPDQPKFWKQLRIFSSIGAAGLFLGVFILYGLAAFATLLLISSGVLLCGCFVFLMVYLD